MEITLTVRDADELERLLSLIRREGLDAHLAGDGGAPVSEPGDELREALEQAFGLTRGGPDGLEVQLALRAEWDHRDTLPPEEPS